MLTFSLSGGADQALFGIGGGTGVLTFNTAPDFETPTDTGADGVYDVEVTVTDNGAGTLTDLQDIAVTITNEAKLTASARCGASSRPPTCNGSCPCTA